MIYLLPSIVAFLILLLLSSFKKILDWSNETRIGSVIFSSLMIISFPISIPIGFLAMIVNKEQ